MRPAGEIRQALLAAAKEYSAVGGASLKELSAKACVGHDAARQCVTSMRRAGALRIVGERKVDYRNRPVAVYALPTQQDSVAQGWDGLSLCMSDWAR